MKYKYLLPFIIVITLSSRISLSQEDDPTKIQIRAAAQLMGIDFSDQEIDLMLEGNFWNRKSYQSLRSYPLKNEDPPALEFNPLPQGFVPEIRQKEIRFSLPTKSEVPDDPNELAFYSIRDLAHLLETRQITSTELTRLYLDRLKKYGSKLHCVVTITEDLALRQAKRADEEIAAGNYRGLLHGIPYGAKDLFSVPGYTTTWGAAPFKDQILDQTATVIEKLEQAGAVLVAKLSLGALAMGDYWYEGMTRNPWNLEQGSSGSSAGSAAATVAGLVAFAIGSETHGSIVSPSMRCGATGLRPTFGRVSRTGAMTLSWSMDKIGPLCRTVEDCAIVLASIAGADGFDQAAIDAAFNYKPDMDLSSLRIGYLRSKMDQEYGNKEFDQKTLETLKALGADLQPVEFPNTELGSLYMILVAEAAAAFDEFTRTGLDDQLTKQEANSWPNVFRKARFIPAVEYIQANRVRKKLLEEMHVVMRHFDVVVAPPFQGNSLLLTNLTGHPCVVVPNGFKEDQTPTGITFIGQLFNEAVLLSVARQYQEATDFHKRHPDLNQSIEENP